MSTVYNKGLRPEDKPRVVTSVVATASGTVSTAKNQPDVFHWRLYLVLAPDAKAASKSVLFDMSPTLPPKGTFIITSKSTDTSQAQRKTELPLSTVGQHTVDQLIQLYLQKGMDRFNFDGEGMGCFYWTITGVQHLEAAGMLKPGSHKALEDFYKGQAKLHPERFPLPIQRGAFYCVFIPRARNGFGVNIEGGSGSKFGSVGRR
ncbi:hypothetical protein LXA43DRAFT_1063578 [Ganoderma leucocontextum]|nr:hypothetical protein LXA43DRAFT_1063578 [Ganoderma leucocontextum]